jgi:hypothetical protein
MNTRPSDLPTGRAQSAERAAVRQFGAALVCALTVLPLHAQTRMNTVYRCEGSPPTYVSSAQAAQSKQCRNIGRLPQLTTRRVDKDKVLAKSRSAPVASITPAAEKDNPPVRTVPLTLQRDRDDERLRVLEDELAQERRHLAELQRQMPRTAPGNVNEPGELSRQIQRAESDIAALTRELSLAQRQRPRARTGSSGTV